MVREYVLCRLLGYGGGRWRVRPESRDSVGAFYDSTLDRYADMALYMDAGVV